MKRNAIRSMWLIAVCLLFLSFIPRYVSASEKMTLFIMGDSKARHYFKSEYPREGWGQELAKYFEDSEEMVTQKLYVNKREKAMEISQGDAKDSVVSSNVVQYKLPELNIENWAKSQASIRTFIKSGRWEDMKTRVKKGDFVLIAFGHNDARLKGETLIQYKMDMIYCIDAIKKKGATPVLITTMPQDYTSKKKVYINKTNYWKKTLWIAKLKKVSCIDMNQTCVNYFNYRGKKFTDSLYLKYKVKQVSLYPNGIDDNTHFVQKDAKVLAKMIAVQLKNRPSLKGLTKELDLDTQGLCTTYKKVKKCNQKKYTKSSWAQVKIAKNRARSVLYSPSATKKQYKSARKSLETAMKGLKKK